MPGRARTILFVVVSNLLGMALLLGLTEGVLRRLDIPHDNRWTPSENAVAQFDAELGWAYRPSLSQDVEFEGRTRPVHFDASGIRVPSADTRLDPEKPSVLFVGGSYTMGHGLSYEESFVGQLGATDEASGHQMVNLGVQAYGTDQALLALRKFLPRFVTEVVVYTFIGSHRKRNDNTDRRILYPGGSFVGTKPRFGIGPDGRPVLRKRPMRYEDYRSSYLLDLVKTGWASRRKRPTARAEELTKALILEMDEYCRSHGVRFVLVDWRWSDRDWDGLADLPVNRIDTLDGAPHNWDNLRIPRDDHPNARASRHVAEQLSGWLAAEGVF